jgi:hypothetical protein
MAKFRKKPVVIDAMQLTWANWNDICAFVPEPWFGYGVWLDKDGNPLPKDQWRFGENNNDLGLIIRTLEGDHLARGNDWIIKGVKGEFYSCRNDVFLLTYEKVEDASALP